MSFDLLVRNAIWRGKRVNVAVADELFAAIGEEVEGEAKVTMDAEGLVLFPGVIDPHVHFNEPGRTEWEGFATGSRAFAAGGGTLFFDMPLNASPPTTTPEAFDLKRAAAEASSVTDFALWGGVTPDNLDRLESLADRGVIGFKAFLSPSGIEEFQHVTPGQLERAMRRIAPMGRLVGVHAEDPALLRQGSGVEAWRRFASSRPPEAELSAVAIVIALSAATKCAAHIVHVSLPESLEMIAAAKARGVNISGEICVHHLLLDEEAMETKGALAKCAPPLRPRATVDRLWDCLPLADNIGSDHSPSTSAMKCGVPFESAWGGISGVQHSLPLMAGELAERSLDLLIALTSSGPARRFGLPPTKGILEAGADADFCLVDFSRKESIEIASLLDRHKHSPYVGHTLRAIVTYTVRRGEFLVNRGIPVTPAGKGKWIRPEI